MSEKKWRRLYASDPNKYASGVYTSKPIEFEGFNQTLFIEKAAYDEAINELELSHNAAKGFCGSAMKMQAEIDDWQSQTEKLAEVLESIAAYHSDCSMEALRASRKESLVTTILIDTGLSRDALTEFNKFKESLK